MTCEVFNAIYNTVDSKTTEELLDIVNNRMQEYTDETKWMIAVVLSKREVEFSLDNFPPNFDYDWLYYYDTKERFNPVYLILVGACVLVAITIVWRVWDDFDMVMNVSGIAVTAIIFCLVNGWKKKDVIVDVDCTGVKSEYATRFVESQNNNKMQFTKTKDLIVGALTQLSCIPTVEENSDDDGTLCYDIQFNYQGVFFVARCIYGFSAVKVFCPNWHAENLDNIKAVNAIKATVNEINIITNVSCSYIIDKDENTLNVYSKYDFYLFPEIPRIHILFATILNDFFQQHNVFFKLLNTGNPNDYAKTDSDYEDAKIYGEC